MVVSVVSLSSPMIASSESGQEIARLSAGVSVPVSRGFVASVMDLMKDADPIICELVEWACRSLSHRLAGRYGQWTSKTWAPLVVGAAYIAALETMDDTSLWFDSFGTLDNRPAMKAVRFAIWSALADERMVATERKSDLDASLDAVLETDEMQFADPSADIASEESTDAFAVRLMVSKGIGKELLRAWEDCEADLDRIKADAREHGLRVAEMPDYTRFRFREMRAREEFSAYGKSYFLVH